MYKLILILSVGVCLFGACTDSDNPAGNVNQSIIGEWTWVRSVGGFAGRTITPDSVGYSITLLFSAQGKYELISTNGYVYQDVYELKHEMIENVNRTVLHIGEDDAQPSSIVEIFGDTLYLSDNCMDCFGRVYVRYRPAEL